MHSGGSDPAKSHPALWGLRSSHTTCSPLEAQIQQNDALTSESDPVKPYANYDTTSHEQANLPKETAQRQEKDTGCSNPH
jgi:hypothetical protein